MIGFDDVGNALPGELLPKELFYNGIRFVLGPAEQGKPNAVETQGQTIKLPGGVFNRVYLLAAAAPQSGEQLREDTRTNQPSAVGDQSTRLTIQNWGGYIGQWDNRLWSTRQETVASGARRGGGGIRTVTTMSGLVPGYIKRAPLAWYASHHHIADGSSVAYSIPTCTYARWIFRRAPPR